MKLRKALKRLKTAESFVCKVVDQYARAEPPIRDLLNAARRNLSRAQVLMEGSATARSTSKADDRPREEQSSHSQSANREISGTARKKLSVAAKKRWAAAKRRGAKSLAG